MAVHAVRVSTAQLGSDAYVVSAAGELDLSSVEPLERGFHDVRHRGTPGREPGHT